MARACCVKDCENAAGGADDVTYFPVPVAPSLRRLWRAALPADCALVAHSLVCIRHFTQRQYETVRGKVRLKGKVVPTVFGGVEKPVPELPKRKQNGRRRVRRRRKSSTTTTDDDDAEEEELSDQSWASDKPARNKKSKKGPARAESAAPAANGDQMLVTPDLGELVGMAGDAIECVPELPPCESGSEAEQPAAAADDIEDIIANYHIKQDQELAARLKEAQTVERERLERERKDRERQETERVENERRAKLQQRSAPPPPATHPPPPTPYRPVEKKPRKTRHDVIRPYDDDDDDILEVSEPPTNFVEIAVGGNESNRDDCLMLMESVQVLLDPTALLDPQDDHNFHSTDVLGGRSGVDGDDVEISLLTSSDDDDVIVQEPHIDTVEVSDETDEDDVPLVKIAKPKVEGEPFDPNNLWGKRKERYCYTCHWVTTSKSEMDRHRKLHETDTLPPTKALHKIHSVELPAAPHKVIQVCEVCHFSTASALQFIRHRKKHKDEKRFKCDQCEYRAKHRMALAYHVRALHQQQPIQQYHVANALSGAIQSTRARYRCHGCRLTTNDEAEMLRHSRECRKRRSLANVRHCPQCPYMTRRARDLRRHMARKHQQDDDDDDDDDDYVPR